MAEEFVHGGVCGGSWWSSPRNLFSSSPCSLASNDIAASFAWPTHDLLVETKTVRSSDDSASDGSTSAVDHHADGNHWNPDMLRDGGRSEGNYSDFQLDSGMDYRPQIDKNFLEDSSVKQGFPLSSDYGSLLLQTLFDADSQPQPSLLDNQTTLNYSSSDSNGFLPSLPKPSPMLRQHFTANGSPLWNSTASALNNVPSTTFLPPPLSQFIPSSLSSISAKHEGKELATAAKKVSHEPAFKRPRIETPSPLPTFKVRKEKLGDRITALQQLVSPFGKTDTASVLHEAIEYIKFLHDQVDALSTPYLKHGSPPLQQQYQQGADKAKDQQALTKDLKTRGLCLVPISSTFPVASETATDFWTPTFGGSFR